MRTSAHAAPAWAPIRPAARRGLALAFAALLAVGAWVPPVNEVVAPLTDSAVPPIPTADAAGTPCSNYSDSYPQFTGWLSNSSGTKLSTTTTGSVYGRIANVDQTWDATHCYAYRYDALVWTPTGSTSNLTVDWGSLSRDGAACRYVENTSDYLHANAGGCPGSPTTARHVFQLNPQGTYRNDTAFDTAGDYAFAHADCYTDYGTYGNGAHPQLGRTTSATSGKPGANCGNKAIDGGLAARS
jgi:hypothetical protein